MPRSPGPGFGRSADPTRPQLRAAGTLKSAACEQSLRKARLANPSPEAQGAPQDKQQSFRIMGPTKQPDDRVLELDAENARLRTLLRQAGIDAGHAADADLETTPNGNREDGGFLRAILESSTDYAIVATDLSGHVTSWNEGARRIMGWTESEMLGERVHRFFTPEDVKNGQPDREMDGVIENGRATDERWHVRSDGSRFWASGMLTPLVTDGNLHVGYVKVLRDLTAQKEAEER